jgi:hypothetical protein
MARRRCASAPRLPSARSAPAAPRARLARAARIAPVLLLGCSAGRDGAEVGGRVSGSASGALAPNALAAPALAPPPISLEVVAGRWQMRAVPESGDTTPTSYVLTATADTSGWSIAFPDGPPVPLRIVAVDGDSIVAETGEYRSVRRRGASVHTRSVVRLDGDHLVGTSVARYRMAGADSVLRLQTEGTRRP